jgi:hypothetical protein
MYSVQVLTRLRAVLMDSTGEQGEGAAKVSAPSTYVSNGLRETRVQTLQKRRRRMRGSSLHLEDR